MAEFLDVVLRVALFLHALMVAVCAWRVWRGENAVDRLVGVDLIASLILALLIILAIVKTSSIYIDVAVGLAVLGYLTTITLARYISEERVF